MNDFMGKLFFGLFFIMLIIFGSVYYLEQQKDAGIRSFVDRQTMELTNSIRSKGYLSQAMYEEYIRQIGYTEQIYSVEFVHTKKIYHPLQITDPGYSAIHTYTIIDEKYFNSKILKSVYMPPDYDYKMRQGDEIKITVKNKSRTSAMILSSFFVGAEHNSIFTTNAGGITNEDY